MKMSPMQNRIGVVLTILSEVELVREAGGPWLPGAVALANVILNLGVDPSSI